MKRRSVLVMIIIDRFEGKYVVVEQDGKELFQIPRQEVPKDAKEGDFLVLEEGIYKIDKEQTLKLREETIRLQNSLWE